MRLKKLAAVLLVLLLLITGLDIRYGVISGPCRRVPGSAGLPPEGSALTGRRKTEKIPVNPWVGGNFPV